MEAYNSDTELDYKSDVDSSPEIDLDLDLDTRGAARLGRAD